MEDSVFWLEKNNNVRVVVRSKVPDVKVVFVKAKIVSQDSNSYVLNFDNPGATAICVYEMHGNTPKLIFTKSYKVKEPTLYFCGVKVGTRSGVYKMREQHLAAFSTVLNTSVRVLQFDMVYYDKVRNKTYHSDTCMLTKEMKEIIFEKYRFAEGQSILFANMMAAMPDGSKKPLSPFGIFLERDSTQTEHVAFIFSVKRVTRKNGEFAFEGAKN